jgi:SMODS and SLOG-associating 2TM effector domain 2
MNPPQSQHADAYADFPESREAYRDPAWETTEKALYKAAVTHARDRIAWYDSKADSYAKLARRIRIGSLALFALGTLAPIVATLLVRLVALQTGKNDAVQWPLAEAGYVLLALAGALVIFDQFFGISSSWMRFRQSQARLKVMLADMRFSWAELMAAQASDRAPSYRTECIALLRRFVMNVELLTEAETKEWAGNFRSQIESFDRMTDLRAKPAHAPLTGQTFVSEQAVIDQQRVEQAIRTTSHGLGVDDVLHVAGNPEHAPPTGPVSR